MLRQSAPICAHETAMSAGDFPSNCMEIPESDEL